MNKYIVTGATGYIGSLMAEKLLFDNEDVTVIVRDLRRLKNSIRRKARWIQAELTDGEALRRISGHYDYIFHCGSPTQSAEMVLHPVETAHAIVDGTRNMLEVAVKAGVKGMVYLSTMEVYGRIDCSGGKRVMEEELGAVDITQARSCYPMAKRMAESYCCLYHSQYQVPVKAARLAQTFGRGVSPGDRRIFAQFAGAVRDKRDIVLHTEGNSVGNYCDIDEVLDGLLFILEHGQPAEAYNIVNEANTMTIRQMAELVAKEIAGGEIGVVYDIPGHNRYGYAADTGVRLSGAKLKALGWEAKVGLAEMYRRMLHA